MTSWIVPFVEKNKDDPRSHTNQHEPKYFRLELDVTFEAKPICLAVLQLSEISQQRGTLVRGYEPPIDDESVRRKKRWQVRWRIESGHSSEESVVVIQYLLECRCGVIVKVGRGSADSTQLCDVHDSKVSGLPR